MVSLNTICEVTRKYSTNSPSVPILGRWKGRDGRPEILKSQAEIEAYLARYYPPDLWELVNQQDNGNTILTYRSIPDAGSPVAKNPSAYPDHYCHIRIKRAS